MKINDPLLLKGRLIIFGIILCLITSISFSNVYGTGDEVQPSENATVESSDKSVTLILGKSLQLASPETTENGSNEIPLWESTDSTVVSVDEQGMVTAHNTGKATVSVLLNNKQINYDILVVLAKPILESLTPSVYKDSKKVLRPQITIKWSTVPNATLYKVYRYSYTSQKWSYIDSVVNTSYVDRKSLSWNYYKYKVYAIPKEGSAYQSVSNTSAYIRTVLSPKITYINDYNSKSIHIRWTKQVGATKYALYRSTSLGGQYTRIISKTTTNHTTYQAIKTGKTYYYKVIAYRSTTLNGKTTSIYSNYSSPVKFYKSKYWMGWFSDMLKDNNAKHSKVEDEGNYGWRICPYHGKEFHSGIDVLANTGSNVRASAGGKVIRAEYDKYKGYGKIVVIDHRDGTYSVYGHNSKFSVKKGQYVIKGQIIAKAGNTGNSTCPHYHFEVRKGKNLRSNMTSPWNYLKKPANLRFLKEGEASKVKP